MSTYIPKVHISEDWLVRKFFKAKVCFWRFRTPRRNRVYNSEMKKVRNSEIIVLFKFLNYEPSELQIFGGKKLRKLWKTEGIPTPTFQSRAILVLVKRGRVALNSTFTKMSGPTSSSCKYEDEVEDHSKALICWLNLNSPPLSMSSDIRFTVWRTGMYQDIRSELLNRVIFNFPAVIASYWFKIEISRLLYL